MTNIHSKIIAGTALCMLVVTQSQAKTVKVPPVDRVRGDLVGFLKTPLQPTKKNPSNSYTASRSFTTRSGNSWQIQFALAFDKSTKNPQPLDLSRVQTVELELGSLRAIKKPNNEWVLEASYECSERMKRLLPAYDAVAMALDPLLKVESCEVHLSSLQPSDPEHLWRVGKDPHGRDIFTNDPLGK